MTKLARLQEKRNKLAGDIKAHAKEFDKDKGWPSVAAKSKWDRLNAAYDTVVEEMDEIHNPASVSARLNQIDHLQNSPRSLPGGVVPGRDDGSRGMIGGRQIGDGNGFGLSNQGREPVMFRDAATGREIRALMPGESYAQVYGADTEYEGEPIPRLGDVLASKIVGRPVNISQQQFAAHATTVDASGGFEILPTLYPQFMDLLRSALVMVRAGAMQIPMDSPEMRIVRLTKDIEANFRSEGQAIKHSTAAFGSYTMRARTVAALTSMPMELAEDAPNAARMIEQSMAAAMALEIDRTILGRPPAKKKTNEEVRGVLNSDGINDVDAFGVPANYGKITKAVGHILNNNYTGDISALSWIMHPRDGETFDGLTATDGQPLMPTPWASQLNRLSTTSLPTDQGENNDESQGVIGDFSQVLIGTMGGVRFQTFDGGHVTDDKGKEVNAVSQWMRHLRMIMRLDSVLLRPTLVTKLSGIKTAE